MDGDMEGGEPPTSPVPGSTAGQTPGVGEGPPGPGAQRRRRMRMWAAALVVLVVALGVGIYFLGRAEGYWGKSTTTMPNLVGQSTNEARNNLYTIGITSITTDVVASPDPIGIVTASRPTAGATVDKGTTVVLQVSGGTDLNDVLVPTLDSLTEAQAKMELAQAHLKAAVVHEANLRPAGTVLSQAPSPGVRVAKGSTVTITVSSGSSTVAVPKVTGDTQAQAGATLGSAGLKVGTTVTQPSTVVGAGYVVGTDPAEGTAVTKGSAINLVISSGAATTTTAPTTTTTAAPATTTTTAPTPTTSH